MSLTPLADALKALNVFHNRNDFITNFIPERV